MTTIQNKVLSTLHKTKNNPKINPEQNTNTKYTPLKSKKIQNQQNSPQTTKNTSLTQK